MKITEIQLVGLTTISIPIVGAKPTDPYFLMSGDGLGPSEVDVSIALTPNQGAVYQGRRPQSKELVLRLGLHPNFSTGQSYSDLRENLYGLLTPGDIDIVTVRLMNGGTEVARITGYVSKMEPTPFSKDPDVQVTIACLSSYFYAPTPKNVNVNTVTSEEPRFINSGNAPTGFKMEMLMLNSGNEVTLFDGLGLKKMQFKFPFFNGDKFTINTTPGSRDLFVTKADGSKQTALYSLTADSTWLMLHGGENAFSTSGVPFDFVSISFVPQYWGL